MKSVSTASWSHWKQTCISPTAGQILRMWIWERRKEISTQFTVNPIEVIWISYSFLWPSADFLHMSAAAAAKSLQSCLTLCDPLDGSPPGSAVPGIPQARTLEWVAISFSNSWKWKVKVKLLSCVWLFITPWTAVYQAPPSMGFSRQEYWSGLPLPSPCMSAESSMNLGCGLRRDQEAISEVLATLSWEAQNSWMGRAWPVVEAL